ncbi:MAG: DUF362 domain-containing protein [Deltaproteobacteria bacterium]|nr:DUF362 domain-containing protein [Deltaproteobacteria bacterium]
MATVVLIRCDTYGDDAVKTAVERGIYLLGGPEKFAKKGEKILLKPNLLVGDPPEKCVTTHPAVFKAVAECFLDTGADITYGDSPAMGSPKSAAKKSGILAIAEKLNIGLADFTSGEEIFFKDGIQNKKFVISKGVLDSDGIISLPKLKTHGLERLTGSVKNQFGCIPGMRKGEYHVKLPDANDFAKMLVDLNRFVNPRLYVMDGIRAMEGNGPRGGAPVNMNILLFSTDPIALDATVCRLIDLNPEYMPTTRIGGDSGAGTYLEEEIELLGDAIDGFKMKNFDVKRRPVRPYQQKGFQRFLNNRLVEKPYILETRCTQCGTCIQACPANPKAVNWHNGDKSRSPVYNYDDCIRCYCCQELCPESAVKLKKPFMRKLLNYVSG